MPLPAAADCSGSGITWTCTAGTTPAQINTTISSASDGATLTFDAGSYTWGGGTAIEPPLTKGITLICVSQGACDVSYSGSFPGTWRPGCCAGGSSSKVYRISGFDFTPVAAATIWFAWDDSPETKLENLRIDHNTWTLDDDDPVMNISQSTVLYLYGVIDHNTVTMTDEYIFLFYAANFDSTSPDVGSLGGSKNLFVEDNVFTIAQDTGGDAAGCNDADGDVTRWVFRFNTITNCRLVTHGVTHEWGPSNFEIYGNVLVHDINSSSCCKDGYRFIHDQGAGTIGVWGNDFDVAVAHGSDIIAFLHYGAFSAARPQSAGICDGTSSFDGNRAPQATYQGYPCKHQPGRDNNGQFYPMFGFKNRWSDDNTIVNMVSNDGGGPMPDYTAQHLVLNRDWYNAGSLTANTCAGPGQTNCSPFTGATGIGHGLLSGRPDACTVGPDSDVGEPDEGRSGVMYWATDQGSWNTSTSNPQGVQQNGADGVLYMCTATNTWSVYYTPYTYPHPLAAGPTAFVATVDCSQVVGVYVATSTTNAIVGSGATIRGCNFGASTGTVHLCNQSTYGGTCTEQTPATWSTTTVTMSSVSKGSLVEGSVYWFVHDTSNNVNATGLLVTLVE